MTDEQIIKAFEEILKNQNNKLSLIEQTVCADVLSLAKHQKAEIECFEKEWGRSLNCVFGPLAENTVKAAKNAAIKEFAEYIIDKSQNSIIQVSDIPDYVKEMMEADK